MTRDYRRAHLIDKPTVYGWHAFNLGTTTARCFACHGVVPVTALDDGSWRWRIGGRCREFLRAIGTTSAPPAELPAPQSGHIADREAYERVCAAKGLLPL